MSLIAAIVALVWFGVSCAAQDRERGLDTTCGDLMEMSQAQQIEVMKDAGIPEGYRKNKITYYLDDCRSHPEDRGHPISDIMG
jgi:hypothetical protein